MNITKQLPRCSQPIGRFYFTQACWQVAEQLQLHCLSRLNSFISCVCAFTYLSSSVIFTADTSSSSRPCCSVECSCKSRTWAHQYTRIHGAFQGVHGFREPGCDKRGVNDTYIEIHRYIPLFRAWGTLSWSIWGSLRLAPNTVSNGIVQLSRVSIKFSLWYIAYQVVAFSSTIRFIIAIIVVHSILTCICWNLSRPHSTFCTSSSRWSVPSTAIDTLHTQWHTT